MDDEELQVDEETKETRSNWPSPIIRCVGGKASLAAQIIAHMPDDMTGYVEPFFGGGAVFFQLYREGRLSKCRSNTVTINDYDTPLMEMYEEIRRDPVDVRKRIDSILEQYEKGPEATFYKIRELWNSNYVSPAKRIFLSYGAFNGLWRVNKDGKMNAPWNHKPKLTALPSLEKLKAVSQALQPVFITSGPFDDCLRFDTDLARPGVTLYLDPPYHATFTAYTKDGFSTKEQESVMRFAGEWGSKGATVLYSNADTPFIQQKLAELWPAGKVGYLETRRKVNSDGTGRGLVRELLVTQNGKE